MALVNTKWSMNRKEFLQDLEQFLSTQQKETTPRMTSPLSISKFEIDYKQLIVEKKIAEGAFGEVFIGKLWGKTVAIKRLKLNYRSQEQEDWSHIIDKLSQEAQIMSDLHHPNVLLLIGVCTQLPNICLVSEYVEQGNLYDYLSQQLVSDTTLFCTMVKDIICGMSYLHNRNVLHLDLKPLNILVQNGTIKIADFGISKLLRRKEETLFFHFQGYGTLLYLSDEILYHNSYSIKSDVFSFGILLYELVYMREHQDTNFTERDSIGFNLLREPLSKREFPKIPPWWDKTLTQLIISCVRTDPQERPTFDSIFTFLFESPKSPFYHNHPNEDWFLMREHSKNMLRLSKQCQQDETLRKSLLEFSMETVLQYTLSIAKDKHVIVNCLFATIQFAIAIQHSNFLEVSSMVLQRWEQEIAHDLPTLQRVICQTTFHTMDYFKLILTHGTKSIQLQCLEILFKLIQHHSTVTQRFVHQHLTETLLPLQSIEPILICSMLCSIVSCIKQQQDCLKKFHGEGGVEALVEFTKMDKTMVMALYALADCSQMEEFTIWMEQKGMKPIQLAMRAFAPKDYFAMNNNYSYGNNNSNSNNNMVGVPLKRVASVVWENTAFEKNHLREEGEKLLPQMRLSFSKAKERFTTTTPIATSLHKSLELQQLSQLQQSQQSQQQQQSNYLTPMNIVVQTLWEILVEHSQQLETISTQELKTQLWMHYEKQIIWEKNQWESQIDRFVGQMESPTQLTNYLFLGSEWNASKMTELTALQIDVIVNVSQESPNYFPTHFKYHHISSTSNEIINYFDMVFGIIENAKRQKQKVLLHSMFGVSRAAAFGIGYLMYHRKYSLQKAFKYVKDLRPIINPSREYMRQLMTFEMNLQGTSTLGVKIECSNNTITHNITSPLSPQLPVSHFVDTPDTSFL